MPLSDRYFRWLYRRRVDTARAEQMAQRQQTAEHDAAVRRILEQAPHTPDPADREGR